MFDVVFNGRAGNVAMLKKLTVAGEPWGRMRVNNSYTRVLDGVS